MFQVRREGWIARLGYGRQWIPALPSAPSVTVYQVYSNTGAGDPINYESPIATVANPGFLTSGLNYPGIWLFGVRAVDLRSGLEEQNIDAEITIVLDASGNDITNQPSPPTGLRVLARAGGTIRVEWGYPQIVKTAKTPSGFHVYLGTGGSPSYAAPVATVSWSSMVANAFQTDLTGLTNGTTYAMGVRAYNSVAEETNTNTVSATAVSVGPAAVASLTATATS